jgi:hypothetical protein
MQKLTAIANKRMELTLSVDEMYKQQLNEKIEVMRKSYTIDDDNV